ncbi:hypothetical protein [Mycolicibacterium sp. XJ870]
MASDHQIRLFSCNDAVRALRLTIEALPQLLQMIANSWRHLDSSQLRSSLVRVTNSSAKETALQRTLRPYVTAGVAIVGASVIAATPVAAPPAELAVRSPQISSAAVELTALAGALDTSSWVDPIAYWAEVLDTTQTNVSALLAVASEDPFPVLNQIIVNQAGYANTIGTALSSSAQGLYDWATVEGGGNLPTVVANMRTAIAEGDLQAAAQEMKFAVTDVGMALFGMLPLLALPYQIAQNFANTLETMVAYGLNTGVVGKSAYGVLNVLNTMIYAVATVGQELIDAAEAGDPVAAVSAFINAPAFLTDSLLNGQAIVRPNGTIHRTPGLLNYTAVHFTHWSLGSALLIHIPRAIAAAITPPAVPATATIPEITSAADDLAALPPAEADPSTPAPAPTAALKELTSGATDTVNGITSAATAAFNAARSVTLKVDPNPEVTETSTATEISADDTTDDATDESNTKADRESKKEARKQAREAKRQERQEARAERQQARQEAKAEKQEAKDATKAGGKHRADKNNTE